MDWWEILSLLVASLAAVFSSIMAALAAKKQTNAQLREAWLRTLKDSLSKLTGSISYYARVGDAATDSMDYRRLLLLRDQILLLLDPCDEGHRVLADRVDTLLSHVRTRTVCLDELLSAHNAVITEARLMFRREWMRPKHLGHLSRLNP